MEYLEGEDLARHLRRRGRMPVDELVDIALPILAAVATAHDEGIVHRDLKPQNVFLAEMPGGAIHPRRSRFRSCRRPSAYHGRPRGAGSRPPDRRTPDRSNAGFVAATACGSMGDFQTCDPAMAGVCALPAAQAQGCH